MMQETVSTTVGGVKNGDRISFSYPSGRTADDYQGTGHTLILPNGTELRQSSDQFFVQYGSSIVVTYGLGPQQSSGTISLCCPLVHGLGGPVTLTQAQYDAITTPDPSTLYVIVG